MPFGFSRRGVGAGFSTDVVPVVSVASCRDACKGFFVGTTAADGGGGPEAANVGGLEASGRFGVAAAGTGVGGLGGSEGGRVKVAGVRGEYAAPFGSLDAAAAGFGDGAGVLFVWGSGREASCFAGGAGAGSGAKRPELSRDCLRTS